MCQLRMPGMWGVIQTLSGDCVASRTFADKIGGIVTFASAGFVHKRCRFLRKY